VKHRKSKLTASVILAALVASLASRAGATERVITIGSKSLLAEAAEHLTTTSSKSVPADVERLATIAAKSLPVEPPTTTGNTLGGLVSNDSTSRFVSLVINKSMAFDLPRDVSDVMVGNQQIANAVLRTKRRVYVIGTGLGQTNVFFYDAKGQQIDALNVNVAHHELAERIADREILVVSGADESTKNHLRVYECTPLCSPSENATPEKKPDPVFVLPNVTSIH
jgi:Flp pilus assembly secretin CpaC